MSNKTEIFKKFENEITKNKVKKAEEIVDNFSLYKLEKENIVSSHSYALRLRNRERPIDGVSYENLSKITNFYDEQRNELIKKNEFSNYFDDYLDYFLNGTISEKLKNSGLDLENNKEFVKNLIIKSIKKNPITLREMKISFGAFNE